MRFLFFLFFCALPRRRDFWVSFFWTGNEETWRKKGGKGGKEEERREEEEDARLGESLRLAPRVSFGQKALVLLNHYSWLVGYDTVKIWLQELTQERRLHIPSLVLMEIVVGTYFCITRNMHQRQEAYLSHEINMLTKMRV